MTAKVLFNYPFGNRAAIHEVAESKWSIPVGVVLVLLTGIARNYDQMWWGETPMFFLGPLVFSFFSGTFLFAVLHQILRRKYPEERPEGFSQYLTFMGLFWMTAPIAWLYAIPTERWFSSYNAAIANVTLLAIVAAWRVSLMARIVSVLTTAPLGRSLLWVLLPASVEVFIVLFFGTIFAAGITRGMAGMRNSPEEDLVLTVVGNVNLGAVIVFVGTVIALFLWKTDLQLLPLAKPKTKRNFPVLCLLTAAAFWFAVALKPQTEARLNYQLEQVIEVQNYEAALELLSSHKPDDFLPARRIPPDPYNYPIWEHLPGILKALDGTEPEWVRKLYLDYFEIAFSHRYIRFDGGLPGTVQSILEIPGGIDWLKNRPEVLDEIRNYRFLPENEIEELKALFLKHNLAASEEPK